MFGNILHTKCAVEYCRGVEMLSYLSTADQWPGVKLHFCTFDLVVYTRDKYLYSISFILQPKDDEPESWHITALVSVP